MKLGNWKVGNWNILPKVKSGKVNGNSCRLCYEEKLAIATYKGGAELLNGRSEIMAKCRHMRGLTLG